MTHNRRRISDYAFVGDCHSAALIREGRIEWLCLPRFDSPSVFAAILDQDRGGHFSITPANSYRTSRAYQPETNVLVTRFNTAEGEIELVDCLPVQPKRSAAPGFYLPYHAVLRRLRCTAGHAEVDIVCEPRPDYAQSIPSIREGRGRWLIGDHGDRLVLDSELPLSLSDGGSLRGRVSLEAGDEASLILQHVPAGSKSLPRRINANRALESTLAFWREWSAGLRYDGPYREQVLRSALVLKGLTYQPTGAIVAAPSTSLPEWLGGLRNWDYRYCWLRDSTFTLYALERLGFGEEAHAFRSWLGRAANTGQTTDVRIAYTLDAAQLPPEHFLDHLEGFHESRPVRVGNDARDQEQLDIYGEILDVAFFGYTHGVVLEPEHWSLLSALADYVCEHWRDPDHGIWEMRTVPRQFVYSKVMCWVCLDRAVRLAKAFDEREGVGRWSREMEAIRADVLRNGYNPSVGAFVQAYGSTDLDAANLALPVVGFIDAHDQRMASTIRLIATELDKDGLIRRYIGVDDGIGGPEGAFMICSFWLVDALIMLGEQEEARRRFERLLELTNDVGLLSEQFDPEGGQMLGNFPQAFSHLALITSALNLYEGQPNRRHTDHR